MKNKEEPNIMSSKKEGESNKANMIQSEQPSKETDEKQDYELTEVKRSGRGFPIRAVHKTEVAAVAIDTNYYAVLQEQEDDVKSGLTENYYVGTGADLITKQVKKKIFDKFKEAYVCIVSEGESVGVRSVEHQGYGSDKMQSDAKVLIGSPKSLDGSKLG